MAARPYRPGVTRCVVNRIVRALLRLGLGPPRTYLLVVPGRKTGRLQSVPVTLVEAPPDRWLVAPYGVVQWVRNVRAAGRLTLARGRRAETLRAVECDPRESAPVLRAYVHQVPITRPFFDVTLASTLEEFEAEAPRHPVFRLLP
ncbi:MAG: nitroreductase family deazaflavin-dependent oxidoreductase [Candidatus Rokubacteria bacterium]|nr:nitroreductase family deazaflavin-dependent oxidoreductase [Candidatus Rokubacteria bacterium]MBI3826384.1 nitroreductase family deazaflavin-dependent oxidoreductase [Candidatus Rokubacteria bacterium]